DRRPGHHLRAVVEIDGRGGAGDRVDTVYVARRVIVDRGSVDGHEPVRGVVHGDRLRAYGLAEAVRRARGGLAVAERVVRVRLRHSSGHADRQPVFGVVDIRVRADGRDVAGAVVRIRAALTVVAIAQRLRRETPARRRS